MFPSRESTVASQQPRRGGDARAQRGRPGEDAAQTYRTEPARPQRRVGPTICDNTVDPEGLTGKQVRRMNADTV